jgi:hypothetical protein
VQHEKKLYECEPEDPNRCQGNMSGEQCRYLSLRGMSLAGYNDPDDARDYSTAINCPKHGGVHQAVSLEKRATKNYRLQLWQERVDEFTENEQSKTLREEVGILRLLLEETINSCNNQMELLMYSNKIADLCMKLEKLVVSANRLESNMGMLLDRGAALAMGQKIVELISTKVADADTIDAISDGIINIFAKTAHAEDEFNLLSK